MFEKGYLFGLTLLLGLVYYVPNTEAGATDKEQYLRIQRNSPHKVVTNGELKHYIEAVARLIKTSENNLFFHESREKQLADFLTKTLNSLTADHVQSGKSVKTIARQLAKMEERVMGMEALIKMNDERQRRLISQLSEGINRLLQKPAGDIPVHPDFAVRVSSQPNQEDPGMHFEEVMNMVNDVDKKVEMGMKEMSNEIKIVGETMEMFTDIVNQRHDRLEVELSSNEATTNKDMNEVINQLSKITATFNKDVASAKTLLSNGGGCGGMSNDVTSRLDVLDKLYKDQEEDMKELTINSNKAFENQGSALQKLFKQGQTEGTMINGSLSEVLDDLRKITTSSQERLEQLSDDVRSAISESAKLLKGDVSAVASDVKEGTSHIMDALDDAGSQVDNLQKIVSENHDDMQHKIKGITKVEQVMINTADAVLETKRSIEFGIQQVILELSDIVKNSGSTINTTLSDQIKSISLDIITNQTTALTNMTSKVEKEISQVWRQIGIMYQQMSQTVGLLDDLQNTTKTHMNASLSHVGSMDGTVGKISTKVAGVEDNLNYLLGRLSLVVSEFNNMKEGVGSELEKLRVLAKGSRIEPFDPAIPIPIKVNHRRYAKYPTKTRPTPKLFHEQSPPRYNNPYNDPYYGQTLPRHPQRPDHEPTLTFQ